MKTVKDKKIYRQPRLALIAATAERGFANSDPDLNYGDGGDAWDND